MPATDDDEESKADDVLEGMSWEREVYVVKKVFERHGTGQAVMNALAQVLGVLPGVSPGHHVF